MTGSPELTRLRHELDQVDLGLVELIGRRLDIVAGVGAAKARTDHPVRDPQRERAVLDRVAELAEQRGVSPELVRRIFRDIIDHAVDLQVAGLQAAPPRPTVGFQGVHHAYSHLAAQKYLSARGAAAAAYDGYPSFAEVIDALKQERCDLAVLPIENTTAGSINQVYDLLQRSDVAVVGEEIWRVDHCLATVREVPVESLTHVLSHPQGLEQCAGFLRSLRHAVPVHVFDTAEAMRAVAERGDPAYAGIGSAQAAQAHGLVVLRRGIADQKENYTRFLVLAREPVPVPARVPSKTSLVLVTRHEEGALLRCLDILAASGHSMTKLESRPLPGRPFEYLFFLDFEGNLAETRTQQVMSDLQRAALEVKVLGSYPAKIVREDAPAVEDEALEAVVAPS